MKYRKINITGLGMVRGAGLFIMFVFFSCNIFSQSLQPWFSGDSVVNKMYLVAGYRQGSSWFIFDRNWKRAVFFTGLMSFYKSTGDKEVLSRIENWAEKQDFKTGTNWFYRPNELACTQVYCELYFSGTKNEILYNTIAYMETEIEKGKPAFESGWDYVDALFVGAPPYVMISKATGNEKYLDFVNNIFTQVTDSLWDDEDSLFYRDLNERYRRNGNGKKVFWSRGNGWAIASLVRMLQYMPENYHNRDRYVNLLKAMAASLATRQGSDGFWRPNLNDSLEFPVPESSGTALFTYAMAWGINNGILSKQRYYKVVEKAWKALYYAVDSAGKVCWGQPVNHKPGKVEKEDSDEFVSGVFLLAASEIIKLLEQ